MKSNYARGRRERERAKVIGEKEKSQPRWRSQKRQTGLTKPRDTQIQHIDEVECLIVDRVVFVVDNSDLCRLVVRLFEFVSLASSLLFSSLLFPLFHPFCPNPIFLINSSSPALLQRHIFHSSTSDTSLSTISLSPQLV